MPSDPFELTHKSRLNWLRAGVLGANDGIVSTAGLVMGVAGATSSTTTLFTAGMAGIIAGAISMAVGEYVSVSSSRDAEKVIGVEHKDLINAWHAAFASAASFVLGAIIPFIAIIISPFNIRIIIAFIAVVAALILTGAISAHFSGTKKLKVIFRVVLGGVLAMVVTYWLGGLFGQQI